MHPDRNSPDWQRDSIWGPISKSLSWNLERLR